MVQLTQPLLLDSAIRDWVLLPILLVMVFVGLLRHYVTQLITSVPKPQAPAALREQRIMTRAQTTRMNSWYLSPAAYAARRDWLADKLGSGEYVQPVPEKKPDEGPVNPLSDPAQMEGMMEQAKKSIVMMVPQTLIMGWINMFFSGFVLLRLPFPLTLRFKLMLQRGIDTPDMDVAWVSSISWYFLCLFGLTAIFRLILGDNNAADSSRDMGGMGALTGAGGQAPPNPFGGAGPDYAKLHLAEKENVELAGAGPAVRDGVWVGADVHERVLRLYGAK
ncbi:transmembrane protein [Tilletiopsis washingtonensis]|uniref:ER membrane protein complex subunit 3 n=1 Tax=Tilletiopsis washingtonensis TaxID=58919 RepID=A0A316Z6Z6_9BASI|nr:transmembrane protein [Tilletiopsis washingtonensis]PWN97540.1 transmembrane protein [Tilletiopsis washingtonensis]